MTDKTRGPGDDGDDDEDDEMDAEIYPPTLHTIHVEIGPLLLAATLGIAVIWTFLLYLLFGVRFCAQC